MKLNQIYNENCLETLRKMPNEFLDCVVTSPPFYGLRDYGHSDQIGLETTFQEYIARLIEIFAEVKRVLKKEGTVWVNLGDSYAGSGNGQNDKNADKRINGKCRIGQSGIKPGKSTIKSKSLLNIPSRFAIAMTDELGFIQRNHVIWQKPICIPSSATDRFTVDFESIFFFTKSEKYYFEQQKEKSINKESYVGTRQRNAPKMAYHDLANYPMAVKITEDGKLNGVGRIYPMRNMRTVWSVRFEPQSENHFASYPTRLIETPIKAGCPVGGVVYDPFAGTGTTAVVAHNLDRNWIGSEISKEYCEIANRRLEKYLMQEKLF